MGALNRPPYGDIYKRNLQPFRMFEVTSQSLPNKTVKVGPGNYIKNGSEVVEYVGGNTLDISPPTSPNTAKWVAIVLRNNNSLGVIDGTPAVNSPPVPEIEINSLPLALIYYKSNDTVITQDMIYDIRPFFSIYYETIPKLSVADFNSSISSLMLDLMNLINSKADMQGTNESEFILNREETGALSSDAYISVNRGQDTKVAIRWNENDNSWEYTNDGVTYIDFGASWSAAFASTSNLGCVKLSVSPVDSNNPIVVGNNDLRLFASETEKSLVLTAVNTTIPNLTVSLNSLISSVNAISSDYVKSTDNRLLTVQEKTDLLYHINHPELLSIEYSNFSLSLAAKVACVDTPEIITSAWTFNPADPAAPFILGTNCIDHLVVGLNANKLQGMLASDFVSATGDNHSFILVDKIVPTNRYRLEVQNGVLTTTLV